MRALGLLLILANLGFLGWAALIDVGEEAPIASSPSSTAPRLVLATEIPVSGSEPQAETPTDTDAPAETENAAQPVSEPLACVSIGPFQDLPDAVQVSAALGGAGFQSRQRLEQGELWVGYWVSVQNLATREEANQALAKLKENGVTDVYLLPGTEPANVLSLGVFSDINRAQRRQAEIRALGLDPQIADRKRSGSVYWVDVDLPEPGQRIDPALLQTQPGKILRLETRGCPPAVESNDAALAAGSDDTPAQ